MSLQRLSGLPIPRRQAARLAEWMGREGWPLRGVLVARRGEGKSDLLRQVYALLFEKAEGPLPFSYAFEEWRNEPSRARHFLAAFCQQVRAFVMRQEELLGEPTGRLESELERPGLPLSLAELARDFLALPESEQAEFAATLPARFAHRERRPVCLLLDDAETCGPSSPFLAFLNSPYLGWLLTGRSAFLRRVAGRQGWSLAPLESLTSEEALAMVERVCRELEIAFSHPAWELWFEMAGTSPGYTHSLIQSAALAGQALDSVEALGQFYAKELTEGSLGAALFGRWVRAIPDRKQRPNIAQRLASLSGAEAPAAASNFPSELWDGLIAEEWVEETASGPTARLGMVERDWLGLVASSAGAGSQRIQARIVQAFLLRAEQARRARQLAEMLKEVREGLQQLAETGFASTISPGIEPGRLPVICSVVREPADRAELFWCYGFHGGPGDRAETACLFLIALCQEESAAREVARWSQQLKEEAQKLQSVGILSSAWTPELGPLSELWVALPPGVSLKAVADERRMRWETLAQLLAQKADTEKVPALSGRGEAEIQDRVRLNELEVRAQWLEEELAAAREQFRKETGHAEAGASLPAEPASPLPSGSEGGDLYWRMSMSLSLLRVSTDLLAAQLQSDPEKLEAVRDLQLQSQRLLQVLRGLEGGSAPEKPGPETKGP